MLTDDEMQDFITDDVDKVDSGPIEYTPDPSLIIGRRLRDRSKLVRRKTYFEEFVANDPWYQKELLHDVGEDELHAAIEDDDFSDESDGGSEAEDEVEEDNDYAAESESSDDDEEDEGSDEEGSDEEAEGPDVKEDMHDGAQMSLDDDRKRAGPDEVSGDDHQLEKRARLDDL